MPRTTGAKRRVSVFIAATESQVRAKRSRFLTDIFKSMDFFWGGRFLPCGLQSRFSVDFGEDSLQHVRFRP
jgi:hypothetical protein